MKMLNQEQLNAIYKYFPHRYMSSEDTLRKRCSNCFIRDIQIECTCAYFSPSSDSDEPNVGSCDFCMSKVICRKCYLDDPSTTTVLKGVLIKTYILFGFESFTELQTSLCPDENVQVLYDMLLTNVLHKPNLVQELIDKGADPDMDFHKNMNFTLLQWLLLNESRVSSDNEYFKSAEILVKASKSGEIFRKRNRMNRTPLGEAIIDMVQTPSWSSRHDATKKVIEFLISWGSDISQENLNTLGIAGLLYHNLYRIEAIEWLIKLGIKYDLNKCIRFGCKETKIHEMRCECGSNLLREMRLGKLIKMLEKKECDK